MWKVGVLQGLFHYDLRKSYREFVTTNNQTGKKYRVCSFFSRVTSKLKTVYKLLYKNGVKMPSMEALEKLTPLGIAVWYMDDGCYNYRNRTIMLSTYGSYDQNKVYQDYFRQRWGIEWRIGRHFDKYFLVRGYKSEDAKKFLALVRPFISEQFKYKLGETVVAARKGDNIVRHSK